MSFKLSVLVAALGVCSAFAAPAVERRQNHLENIQCRCLTFRANEQPNQCNFLESKDLGWESAQTIASQHDIQVQFASKSTIAKILAIPDPVPSEVLQLVSIGDAQSMPKEAITSQSKIVCGFGTEVRHMAHHHQDDRLEGHFVGKVIAWLMLFIILYAAGEYVWTRWCTRRRLTKLKVEEKPLKVTGLSSTTPSKHTPSNFT